MGLDTSISGVPQMTDDKLVQLGTFSNLVAANLKHRFAAQDVNVKTIGCKAGS
jgi:hypothetical protein